VPSAHCHHNRPKPRESSSILGPICWKILGIAKHQNQPALGSKIMHQRDQAGLDVHQIQPKGANQMNV